MTSLSGIVQQGPYKGQGYFTFGGRPFPGWVRVVFVEDGAERDVPERFLAQREIPERFLEEK